MSQQYESAPGEESGVTLEEELKEPAMYRVLLQSRPDAPNDMVIQIPLTCSTLLPSLLQHFVGPLSSLHRRFPVCFKTETRSNRP